MASRSNVWDAVTLGLVAFFLLAVTTSLTLFSGVNAIPVLAAATGSGLSGLVAVALFSDSSRKERSASHAKLRIIVSRISIFQTHFAHLVHSATSQRRTGDHDLDAIGRLIEALLVQNLDKIEDQVAEIGSNIPEAVEPVMSFVHAAALKQRHVVNLRRKFDEQDRSEEEIGKFLEFLGPQQIDTGRNLYEVSSFLMQHVSELAGQIAPSLEKHLERLAEIEREVVQVADHL